MRITEYTEKQSGRMTTGAAGDQNLEEKIRSMPKSPLFKERRSPNRRSSCGDHGKRQCSSHGLSMNHGDSEIAAPWVHSRSKSYLPQRRHMKTAASLIFPPTSHPSPPFSTLLHPSPPFFTLLHPSPSLFICVHQRSSAVETSSTLPLFPSSILYRQSFPPSVYSVYSAVSLS